MKSYQLSPIIYTGSKNRALKYIIPLIANERPKVVISPFLGGGSVEINLCNIGIKTTGFDCNPFLINLWKFILYEPRKLYDELITQVPSKQFFLDSKKLFEPYFNKTISITQENKLEVAKLFTIVHCLSFGPNTMGSWSNRFDDYKNYKSLCERIRDFKNSLIVNQGEFDTVIPKFSQDFLFLDPPYYSGPGGCYQDYYPCRDKPIYSRNFNHQLLRDLLVNHKGKFFLTYNNCDYIRNLYNGFNFNTDIQWDYVCSVANRKKSNEIIITNY